VTLPTPKNTTRCHIADLLAALCVLAPLEAQPLLLDAFLELKIALDEKYRFDWLIASLEAYNPYSLQDDHDPGSWEWRTAVLGLLNGICNAPDDFEARCQIRGELQRRGLDTAIMVCFATILSDR
jgi:diaphanous 1